MAEQVLWGPKHLLFCINLISHIGFCPNEVTLCVHINRQFMPIDPFDLLTRRMLGEMTTGHLPFFTDY